MEKSIWLKTCVNHSTTESALTLSYTTLMSIIQECAYISNIFIVSRQVELQSK